jgi:glycosyltransferase
MKRKELYIFNGTGRAAVYGIGTYVDQLKKALQNTGRKYNIVSLYAAGNETEVVENDDYRQINIPFPSEGHKNAGRYYSKNVAYILREIIPVDRDTEYIFHVNTMNNTLLVRSLKSLFKCRVILVSHYTDWGFILFGDYQKMKKLINKQGKVSLTKQEKAIIKNFREDVNMINSIDRFVCVARHTLDSFCKLGGIREDKAEVINNALEDVCKSLSEEEKLSLRKKYLIGENEKIILFAGRLEEAKGIPCLLKAFGKVITTYSDTRLFLVGDGNFRQWLKESEDIWAKITFTGCIDKSKLYELYSIADIGVVCSLHEAFGYVATEMMMHALPVIVTKTGGLDEIVEDGVSGLKVPVRTIKDVRQVNVKILSEKICLLLENSSIARELGENGRKRFLERFELSIFKEKMLKLYNNI